MPAESARMHVFDSVHTRMGASDNLAMGRSTFLEASQTSTCPLELNTATTAVLLL